jgi:stage III sporulation protein AA
MLESVIRILPERLASCVVNLPDQTKLELEEIRIREARPLEILRLGQSRFVSEVGAELERPASAYRPSREDCVKLLDKLSNHSLYTLEEELRRGYITVRGGHRVGIAGRVVLEKGYIKQIKDITCFNLRVAREVPGASLEVMSYLLDPSGHTIHNTLIVSPPGLGKTTLLRDTARQISYGSLLGSFPWSGRRVAMVDERSELAACVAGVPSFDVGPRTDVLDACPKAEGMMMMIRSMSPQVMAVDEIGRAEDVQGLQEAMLSGVRLIATAHGDDLDDLSYKPVLGDLIRMKLFSRYVVLCRNERIRPVIRIFDQEGKPILRMNSGVGSYESI